MRRSVIMGMVLMAVCCFTLSAAAQPKPEGPGPLRELFDKADANGDGKVTLEEAKTVIPTMTEERFKTMDKNGDGVLTKEDRPEPGEMLKKADTNGDGKVTYEEIKALVPEFPEERFKMMDRNGDGVLTKEDRPEPGGMDRPGLPMELFKKADANNDGKVTYEEMKVVLPMMPEERFKMLDSNKDGVITKEDQPEGPPRELLKEADKNGDGKVTFEELKAVVPNMTQEKFDRMDRNKDGVFSKEDRPAGQGQPGKPKPDGEGLLKKADANNDGKITFEELKAVRPQLDEQRFSKMDRNGDGALTADEIPPKQDKPSQEGGANPSVKPPEKTPQPKS